MPLPEASSAPPVLGAGWRGWLRLIACEGPCQHCGSAGDPYRSYSLLGKCCVQPVFSATRQWATAKAESEGGWQIPRVGWSTPDVPSSHVATARGGEAGTSG